MYRTDLFDSCLVDINTESEMFLSQNEFNQQFRTWQLSVPRRSGKTSWILKQLRRNDIVITPAWGIPYSHHKHTRSVAALNPSSWPITEKLINEGLYWDEICSRRVFLDETKICPEIYQIKAERYISLGTFE